MTLALVSIDILIIAFVIKLLFKEYSIFINSILWMWRFEENDIYNFKTLFKVLFVLLLIVGLIIIEKRFLF